eukprot:ctg_626.g196
MCSPTFRKKALLRTCICFPEPLRRRAGRLPCGRRCPRVIRDPYPSLPTPLDPFTSSSASPAYTSVGASPLRSPRRLSLADIPRRAQYCSRSLSPPRRRCRPGRPIRTLVPRCVACYRPSVLYIRVYFPAGMSYPSRGNWRGGGGRGGGRGGGPSASPHFRSDTFKAPHRGGSGFPRGRGRGGGNGGAARGGRGGFVRGGFGRGDGRGGGRG